MKTNYFFLLFFLLILMGCSDDKNIPDIGLHRGYL